MNMNILESINLFPESRMLRVKKNPQLDHKCGGLSSLAILLSLLALMSFQLYQAFKMETILFTKETVVDQQPVMTNISTHQSSEISPYMMAFYLWNRGCQTVTYTISAIVMESYGNRDYATWQVKQVPVPLQHCTSQHFQQITQLKQAGPSIGLNSWYCLPLNSSIQIGGHFEISNTYKGLQVFIECSNACQIDSCGTALIYHVNSVINPNNQQPFSHLLKRDQMDLTVNTFKAYAIRINQNIVSTDRSLLPLKDITIKRSYSSELLENRASIQKRGPSYTLLWIQRSPFTNIVNRRYLKLLDVASYVGGIFPTLFSFFFFMKFVGIYFFDMTFAYQHFKCKEIKGINFLQYIKHVTFKILQKLGYPPQNWAIAKKQYNINQSVNNMLDINYLFKRIEFLQCAISSLLDVHQLKGIYLSQINLKMAQKQYKKHRIRDRVIKYLDKQIEQRMRKELTEREQQINQNANDDMRPPKKKIKVQNEVQDNVQSAKSIHRAELNNISHLAKMEAQKPVCSNNQLNAETGQTTLQREDILFFLRQQQEMVEDISQSELDQQNLKKDLKHDLRKLFKEAEKGNVISRRIVQNIDRWLQVQLKDTIEQIESENPMEILYTNLET